MKGKYPSVRRVYLYLFSFLGLVLVVIGFVKLLDLGMKVYVFRQADKFIYYPSIPERFDKDGTEIKLTPEEEEKFKKEQEEAQKQQTESQRQRDASGALAMIIVGTPLFLYHWRVIHHEKE